MNAIEVQKVKKWLKLFLSKGVGAATFHKLLNAYGNPETFVDVENDEFMNSELVSSDIKKEVSSTDYKFDWEKICKLMDENEISFITIFDDQYPTMLKNIYLPPPFLFIRGELSKQDMRKSIGVVGTRKASNYGKLTSKKIVTNLVKTGFTVISGLAFGIDSIAHLTALEENGRTIAVMGTGCENIYPSQHKKIAERILEKGALISEVIPGSPIDKWSFANRNRIISGMSLGIFVVEGSKKSGALLTAKFAMEQNRDVFALPGDINREQSEGTNYLISQGAKIVLSSRSIIEEYEIVTDKDTNDQNNFPELDKEEELIYNIVIQNKPEISMDEIMLKSRFEINQLSSVLLMLELKSVIRRNPGGKFSPLF